MEAAIVKAHGRKVGRGTHAKSMQLWKYRGCVWAIFAGDSFAYAWGRPATAKN